MANSDISGQITDGSGNAIGSAEVYLWREDLAGAGGIVASTTADSSGNFAFTAHPDGSGSSESWHVAAKDPNANVQLQSAYGVTASPPTSVDSQFDVSITGTPASPVRPGETLTVDASLSNSGTDSDTQTITLDVDNGVGQVDSSLEAAQGGASKTVPLSWSVPSGQTEQDYTATVSSADDTASQTVTVRSAISGVIHRWKLDDVGTETLTDYAGSADGTKNSASLSGTWTGGYALDGDSSNPDELPEQETWLSNMDTGFALAHTFQASSDGYMFGTRSDSSSSIWGGFGTDYDPGNRNAAYQFTTRDGPGSGANTNNTNGTYLDGNKHRVLVTGSDAHPDNIEIYADGTADGFNQRDDSGHTAVTGEDTPWFLFNRNGGGGGSDGIIDNFVLWDRELTASEAQTDYNNQPWS